MVPPYPIESVCKRVLYEYRYNPWVLADEQRAAFLSMEEGEEVPHMHTVKEDVAWVWVLEGMELQIRSLTHRWHLADYSARREANWATLQHRVTLA